MEQRPQPQTKKHAAKILLVDDHPFLRSGLAHQINAEPDLTVCGEAETAGAALQAIPALKPGLVIVDITLKSDNGLELIKNIRALCPKLPILVLSMHDETLYAERALKSGANGYIMKSEPAEQSMVAIHQVLGGETYLSNAMMKHVVARATGHGTEPKAASRYNVGLLSDRELEVFELIGQGLGSQEIARRLHLSPKTVVAHRGNIKHKLKLASSQELIRQAIYWVRERHAD